MKAAVSVTMYLLWFTRAYGIVLFGGTVNNFYNAEIDSVIVVDTGQVVVIVDFINNIFLGSGITPVSPK